MELFNYARPRWGFCAYLANTTVAGVTGDNTIAALSPDTVLYDDMFSDNTIKLYDPVDGVIIPPVDGRLIIRGAIRTYGGASGAYTGNFVNMNIAAGSVPVPATDPDTLYFYIQNQFNDLYQQMLFYGDFPVIGGQRYYPAFAIGGGALDARLLGSDLTTDKLTSWLGGEFLL